MLEGATNTIHTRDDIIFDYNPLSGRTIVTYISNVTLLGRARRAQPLVRAVMRKVADDAAAGLRAQLRRLDHKFRP